MSKGGKGGSSAPSGTTTSTQQNTPWVQQVPYLTGNEAQTYTIPGTGGNVTNINPANDLPGVMPSAASLYANYTPQYFPDSTVSPFNQTQNSALGQLSNFGLNGGSSSVQSGNNAITAINSGAFLGKDNPYLQNTVNSISDSVLPAIDSHFNKDGRFGSNANVAADSSAVANAVAPLQFNDYEQQIGNMLQGSIASPVIQAGQESAMNDALTAGGQQQQQSQAQLNDQVNRFNFQQQLPYNMLSTYSGLVNGNYGGTGTLTQPYFAQGGSGGKGGSGGGSTGQILSTVGTIAAKAAIAY